MKIFTKDIDVEGRPAILVYSNVCEEGIYVTWDEIESGSLSLADAKERVEQISEEMVYDKMSHM